MHAARHYAEAGGPKLGERVFEEALAALEIPCRNPNIGSPRLGKLCKIPGLRSWRVEDFPMQWLYFVRPDHLDIVRLLGDRQDILAILGKNP